MEKGNLFESFCGVMDRLLAEDGCPWDRAQTHTSLRPYLLEEAYETADAIDRGDMPGLCEELGDLLMEVVFHAKLAEQAGTFTTTDVINGITQKLISRHSHVFGTDKAADATEVEAFWEANKKKEKNYANTVEKMKAVPKAMPSLMRAEKVLKRSGEEFTAEDCFSQAHACLNDLEKTGKGDHFGELLLILVKLSGILEINAEFSLTNRVEAFINSSSRTSIKEDME